MKTLVVLSILIAVSNGIVLDRCELVNIIKSSRLTQITQYSVADWICLAHYESGYNTMEVGQETKDGKPWASNYGIFQISSKYWCNNEETPDSTNGCGIRCKELLGNNLEPTISCASKIVSEKGMEAWSSWVENCKGKWINYFTYFCF